MFPGMQIIEKYFPTLSSHQKDQINRLQKVYSCWNSRINVISRKDIDNIYERHVLHSLSIAKILSLRPGAVVLDAGTGGGFPGIPLSIIFPEANFILADSITKKIRVVDAVIRELKLNNCSTFNGRVESFQGQTDFVTARAVTDLATLLNWTRELIIPGGKHSMNNGLFAFKGGDPEEELKVAGPKARIFRLGELFSESFFESKWLIYVPR
jgi:16S rRNA (guanine527-N7)-methyltransferase